MLCCVGAREAGWRRERESYCECEAGCSWVVCDADSAVGPVDGDGVNAFTNAIGCGEVVVAVSNIGGVGAVERAVDGAGGG